MDEATRAELARLIAAHEAKRDELLNQAHYHAGAADALRALLAPPPPPPDPGAA